MVGNRLPDSTREADESIDSSELVIAGIVLIPAVLLLFATSQGFISGDTQYLASTMLVGGPPAIGLVLVAEYFEVPERFRVA